MAIDDPVVIVCDPDYELPYYLVRGRETFYDENRKMRRWLTIFDAVEWARSQEMDPLEHLPEKVREKTEKRLNETRQLRLI